MSQGMGLGGAPRPPTYTELQIRESGTARSDDRRRFWVCSACSGVVVTNSTGSKVRHDSFHIKR